VGRRSLPREPQGALPRHLPKVDLTARIACQAHMEMVRMKRVKTVQLCDRSIGGFSLSCSVVFESAWPDVTALPQLVIDR